MKEESRKNKMETKIIKYTPKFTNAKTTYLDIDPSELQFLHMQLIQYLSRIGEMDNTTNEDFRAFNTQYLHRRRKELPKGENGLNTPVSFISGIINNMMFGKQRDLTDRQIEGIESVSAILNQVWEDLPAIRFQLGFL